MEREQLRLVYQPQVDGEGVIVGAEALVRWTNHQGVTIPPDKFIPLAEQTGQIHAIGAWVIETAFAQILSWQSQGLIVPPIAVNVSAVQLEPRLPSLPDTITQPCSGTAWKPAQVELEITETALMAYPKEAAEQLNALTAMGFKLAIDDFGTGYSSLATLHSLHLSKLKIDRCFVDRLEQTISRSGDRARHHQHGARTGPAHPGRRRGNREAVELLQELGCDLFQGYLFDRPLPQEQFASKLQRAPLPPFKRRCFDRRALRQRPLPADAVQLRQGSGAGGGGEQPGDVDGCCRHGTRAPRWPPRRARPG